MSYEVTYIDGLQGTWIAEPTPVANAPIAPYSTGADGGFAFQAPRTYQPPVGSPTAVLDRALDAETYITPTGARAWRPTAAENALVDAVTQNPYSGLDELVEAGGRGAGGGAAKNLPYVGDVVGGVVDGAVAYGNTGSLPQGIGAGVGSTVGGIAGTAVGGALGAVGGPVGVAVGGVVGGAVGAALGRALGQGLGNLVDGPPQANINGAEIPGSYPYSGENAGGQLFQIYWDYKYEGGDWTPNSWVGVQHIYPYRTGTGDSTGCSSGVTNKNYSMNTWGLAAGCGAEVRNIRTSPWPGGTNTPLQPVVPPQKNPPTIPNPTVGPGKGFPLPEPVTGTPRFPDRDPSGRPLPRPTGDPPGTTKPAPAPKPNPIGGPIPIPSLPKIPDFGLPSTQPKGGTHKNPYPDGDPVNPNPVQEPPPEGDPCDPCVELGEIKAKLEETFSLAWALPDCGVDFQITRTGEKEGQGLAGLSQKIDGLYQILRVLHSNTRCDKDSFVVVPDSWPMKVEAGRPQLVLVYATKNKDKTWGSRRYEFCIPHFDGKLRKALKTLVPKEIKKGSHQGTYTLADNSKIITYCKTKTEAMRIINAFDKLVLKDQKTTNKKTGEINPNTKFLELTLYPFEARFFSQGQQNPNPDWKDKLF